jgi:hypothetical protein
MKHSVTILLAGALALTSACKPVEKDEAPKDAASDAAGSAAESSVKAPAVAATDNLMKLTCADFLATAQIAMTEPADDAALAAQDELANGLTWVHGYLYAKNGGKYDALSQDWMKVTAKRIFDNCSAAKDAKATSLFEVATS